MLPTLFATLSLLLAQDSEPIPASPHDRIIELEITEHHEVALEGRGPTAVAEYEVQFDGTLHIWTRSELDLFLRVDDASEARPLASDDNSGGGTTPYVALEVETGDWLVVLIAGEPGAKGPLTLHLTTAVETEAGRAAAKLARDTRVAATRLLGEGQRTAARDHMASALPGVMNAEAMAYPDLLGARASLAASMHEVGDLAGARALRESVLAAHERTLPEDHPDLLLARMELAVSMSQMGDLVGAHALEESVLAAFERTLPEDHPDLLVARGNLAASMDAMGDLAGARALKESVVAARERILPEGHPDLLLARNNLAGSMYAMGNLTEARALFESVLAARERSLPPDHPNLLRARLGLASSMHEMGDLAGARALFESVLAARERSLPADHPSLLLTRNNLAGSMYAMGDLAGARALYESVVASSERSLSAEHPVLLSARGNLALSMDAMGDLAGARELRASVLAACESSRPADHPELLRARGNLASSLLEMGDLAGGSALWEATLAGYERTLPEYHPELLLARGNLAGSMHAMGDLDRARALRESVLAAYERSLPIDHPALLLARADLALSLEATGDLAGARALLPAQVGGMRTRILASLALAPRQARQTVASEGHRHSEVLFLSASQGPKLERIVFELTETMRHVATEATRSLARFVADPELAPILQQAREIRRALNDLVAGAARDEAGREGLPAELTRLSLKRDALEREASRRLAERGVVTEPVTSDALSAALDTGDVVVGYRRVSLRHVDPSGGETQDAAEHLLAHVLNSEGTLNRIDLGPASELEELASEWRAALGAPLLRGLGREEDEDDLESRVGRELRARVLDPVLALAGDDVARLFICADDLLFLLPLDALPVDENGKDNADGVNRLGDRLRIVNEVSLARLLAPASKLQGVPSLLAFGGVDYDAQGAVPEGLAASSAPIEASDAEVPVGAGGEQDLAPEDGARAEESDETDTSRSAYPERFRRLRQARYEAEATADLFDEAFDIEGSLLLGKDTTKAALFEAAPGKRYLHLATHGWFAPDSVRSTEDARPVGEGFTRMGLEDRVTGLAPMTLCGLALAGANKGRDSLGRVPGILTAEELCSLDLSQCELAVLSACETNVGIRRAGQGIQSLQSALYAAGARTSITSLWKVDDAATRRLMEAFYDNLWVQGMGKSDALWQAKQTMRDEGDPPAHWAGWVLTGDPE